MFVLCFKYASLPLAKIYIRTMAATTVNVLYQMRNEAKVRLVVVVDLQEPPQADYFNVFLK